MAVISIPSSIGGISIPGVTNGVGGPLASLFRSTNTISTYQYPRDLGSGTRGHWIQFTAYKRTAALYDSNSTTNVSPSQQQNGSPSLLQRTLNAFDKTVELGGEVYQKGASEVYSVALQDGKVAQSDVISLYMPDSVAFQYNAAYGNVSLTNELAKATAFLGKVGGAALEKLNTGAGNAVGSAIQSISSAPEKLIRSDIGKLALSIGGVAINPQQQLLFDGIDFRTYQLAFTFTPYSAEEAETVKNIIQTFRKHAAPTIQEGYAGIFFTPPATFKLDFKFNGKINENVTKVKESVITNIDVNYSPNGWSTFGDGAPVQTILTLDFKEIALVDSNDIKNNGY